MTYDGFVLEITKGITEIPAIPFYYLNFRNEFFQTKGKLMFKTKDEKGLPFYSYMTLNFGNDKKETYLIRGYVEGKTFEVQKQLYI